MQESISAPQVGGIIRLTGRILKASLLIEAVGSGLLALRFCPDFGLFQGLWLAVFHSVSAFCNAGFDLMGSPDAVFVSLTGYHADALVLTTISLLIIIGGIGFLTWEDMVTHRFHVRHYRLQSKLILCTTAALLLISFLFFFFYEFALPQWREFTWQERLQTALFQAVTPRTAGFNMVDLTKLSPAGHLFTIALMLVGGAPGSTAGGFKVTTLALLLLNIRACFHHHDSAHCFGRRIPDESTNNAFAIFALYCLLFLSGGLLICCIDGVPLMAALFESASAVATVGLSLGVTGTLSAASRWILIAFMYLGRAGGLTLLYAVARTGVSASRFPQERVSVG